AHEEGSAHNIVAYINVVTQLVKERQTKERFVSVNERQGDLDWPRIKHDSELSPGQVEEVLAATLEKEVSLLDDRGCNQQLVLGPFACGSFNGRDDLVRNAFCGAPRQELSQLPDVIGEELRHVYVDTGWRCLESS